MSAVDDYRRFTLTISGFKTTHEARVVAGGFDEFRLYADRAVAELETKNEGLRSRRLPYAEAEVAQKRYEDAEAALAERDRMLDVLRDGLIRVIQCNNYPMTIPAIDLETGEAGPHGVDGYNCSDVLAIIHEVFPDFCKWDDERAQKQLRARAEEGSGA